jgi:hypothetical protein
MIYVALRTEIILRSSCLNLLVGEDLLILISTLWILSWAHTWWSFSTYIKHLHLMSLAHRMGFETRPLSLLSRHLADLILVSFLVVQLDLLLLKPIFLFLQKVRVTKDKPPDLRHVIELRKVSFNRISFGSLWYVFRLLWGGVCRLAGCFNSGQSKLDIVN